MAIDTAQKRRAMMNFGPPLTRTMPIPGGGIDEGDRAILLWMYFGLSAAALFGYGRNAALVTRRLRAAVPPRKTRTAVVARRERAKTSEQN